MDFEMARAEEYYRHAEQGVLRLATGRLGVMTAARGIPRHPCVHPPQPLRRVQPPRDDDRAQKAALALRAQRRLWRG